MVVTIGQDLVTHSLNEARTRARELQIADYGLQDALTIDGGGYEFIYVREADKAISRTLLIPEDRDNQPGYVIARCDETPLWRRIVVDEAFSTFYAAADYRYYMPEDSARYEIKPHINTLS